VDAICEQGDGEAVERGEGWGGEGWAMDGRWRGYEMKLDKEEKKKKRRRKEEEKRKRNEEKQRNGEG
jgi:hypothetical protein